MKIPLFTVIQELCNHDTNSQFPIHLIILVTDKYIFFK